MGGAGGREPFKDDIASGVRRAKELLGRPVAGAGAGAGGATRSAPTAAPAPSRGPVRTGAEGQKENIFAFAARGGAPAKDKERHPLAGHNYLAPHPNASAPSQASSPFKRQRVGAPAVGSFRPARPASAAVHHVDLQTLLQNRVTER